MPSFYDNNSSYQTTTKPNLEELTTDKLVELYAHARKLDDIIQQVAIYNQLEKRCNGEDSRLMTDPMMQQTLAAYQRLERSILTDKRDAMKREIKKLTKGGDATQIQNIPKDLLIKITAISSLL